MTTSETTTMSDTQTFSQPTVLNRIECEYREMPGLNVTPDQGARLWAVPRVEVVAILDRLVERGATAEPRRHLRPGLTPAGAGAPLAITGPSLLTAVGEKR